MQKLCCVCTIQQPLPVWIIVTSLPTHISINSHPFPVGIVSSKHCDHPTVYPMILKLLITRGNITLIPKEATQEKEKEILKSQPEKLKKK